MSSFKVIIQKNCCSICLDFAAKKVTFSDSGKISPDLVWNERRESGQKIRSAPVRKNILRVSATPGPDLRAGVPRHVRLPSQRLRAGAGAVKVSQERAKNLLVPNAWLRAYTAIFVQSSLNTNFKPTDLRAVFSRSNKNTVTFPNEVSWNLQLKDLGGPGHVFQVFVGFYALTRFSSLQIYLVYMRLKFFP